MTKYITHAQFIVTLLSLRAFFDPCLCTTVSSPPAVSGTVASSAAALLGQMPNHMLKRCLYAWMGGAEHVGNRSCEGHSIVT